MKGQYVKIYVERIVRETEDAVLVSLDDDSDEQWIPRSQIHDASAYLIQTDDEGVELLVTRWIAEKIGIDV